MKKLFLTLFIFIITIATYSQQVTRQRVVIENFTADWCGWCPSAHQGIQDLIAAGYDVAPIAYHGGGDPFQTSETSARHSYYGVGGIPHSQFDGVIPVVGGSSSGTTYSTYLPPVQSRLAIPCDYTVSIFGENTGLDYAIAVILELVNGTPPNDLTLQLVVCENHIPYNWQGETECLWVCRDMIPDQYGTTVDFSTGNQQVYYYAFSIDPTWTADNLEFTAFLQNEADKEILQGNWVPKPDLTRLVATANFSVSNQQPCETTPVDFYDNSLGIITSWEWVFEGGTPATSTLENPVVTYNTPGTYDVQLTVSDGATTDVLLMPDYIDVQTTPPQADAPTGASEICGGESENYTTNAVPTALDYTWSLTPASAGTVMGNSTIATVTLDPAYSGTFDIKVRADNQCGDGVWSQAFTATALLTPTQFWMSDGATYCEGTQGVEVTLDGSETGVNYDLLLDGTSTGNILAGTGDALNFGYQMGPGIYSIHAITDFCQSIMFGNAYIHPVNIPGQAATPYGDESACGGDEDTYSTNGASDADTYLWTLDPPEAGVITGNTVDASVVWSDSYSGTATITVQGINDCGDGTVSDPILVNVSEIPEPVISGDNLVCENTPGYMYESPDHAQASYTWTVTGGTITDGQGTHQITISWGDMGTGYVNLSEMSMTDCEGVAAEFEVSIDECVGLDETFLSNLSLYPNPVKQTLNIEMYSAKDISISIQVVNQLGQIVIQKSEQLSIGNNKVTINTSDVQNGYYSIKLTSSEGPVIQEKFVKMK